MATAARVAAPGGVAATEAPLFCHPIGPASEAGASGSSGGRVGGRRLACGFAGGPLGSSTVSEAKERRPTTAATAVAIAAAATVGDEPRLHVPQPPPPLLFFGHAAGRAVWLFGGLVLIVAGARWGAEVGASRRLEVLEARLRRVESQQEDCCRGKDRLAASCVTRVQRTGGNAWRLLHADGSEAGHIDIEALLPTRGAPLQCIVNITTSEDGALLRVHHLGGEVAEVALGPRADGFASSTGRASGKSGDRAAERIASELMRAPAHALQFSPSMSAQAPLKQDRVVSEYPELTCSEAANSADWLEVKRMTSLQFSHWRAGVKMLATAQLQVLVDSAVSRLSAHSHVDECGMGRLCMSLLAIIASNTGGSLIGARAIHSPVLTILLDVPWRLVIQSGWPLFAMLAQLHLRARRPESVPTTGGPAEEYFHTLAKSLEQHQVDSLAGLGATFLRLEEGRAHASAYVTPGLCALASQLLSPEVGTAAGMPAGDALQRVQGFFRQAVQSIEDLQGTLDSAWPFFGVLHLAALHLSLAN